MLLLFSLTCNLCISVNISKKKCVFRFYDPLNVISLKKKQSSSPAIPLFPCPVYKTMVGKPMERVPDQNKAFTLCWNDVLMISVKFSQVSSLCRKVQPKTWTFWGTTKTNSGGRVVLVFLNFSFLTAYWMYTLHCHLGLTSKL